MKVYAYAISSILWILSGLFCVLYIDYLRLVELGGWCGTPLVSAQGDLGAVFFVLYLPCLIYCRFFVRGVRKDLKQIDVVYFRVSCLFVPLIIVSLFLSTIFV